MKANRAENLARIESLFRCPLCATSMIFSNGSLKCRNKHCFDISSKGYINFVPHQKPSKEYSKGFFLNRTKIMEEGFYEHILEGIKNQLRSMSEISYIIEVGCGEGYYSKKLQEMVEPPIIAFDILKDAIQVATRGVNRVCWLVADITNIPLQSNSVDCILDIFAPSNYTEFRRLLKEKGVIIKIVPGENHLKELRHVAKDYIRSDNYSNEQVVDYFHRHFRIIDRQIFSKTLPVSQEQLESLCQMTPLLFGLDKTILEKLLVLEITIEAEMLVGVCD